MRSLFWTFVTAFLLVLVTSLLLQALVIVAVVHPLTERRLEVAAESLARDAAAEIAALGEAASDEDIGKTLRGGRERGDAAFPVYRGEDGHLVAGHRLPAFLVDRYARLIETGEDPGPGPGPGPGRDRRRGPSRRDERAPEEQSRRGGPDDPRSEGPPREARRFGLRILAEWPVGAAGGTVFALGPALAPPLWPSRVPRPLLLFFPLAIVLSTVAAFVVFRLVVRRLRALEALATRVTGGDLTARVEDRGRDEIGRLAARLNRMTESLAEARDRIEENDQARRRLFADIGHELATPMTSIKGYAETLTDPSITVTEEERTSFLANVLEETNRLDALAKDLFELTRLEAGAMPLECERLDVADLLRHTLKRYEPRFREAGLTVEWRGGGARAEVEVDGRRIEQVVDNLLRNALRYVPAGGHVTVTVEPAAHGGGRHVIRIEDDGPGIPAEHLDHVFERFYRVDPARADEGTGLGLAIAREIVERHAGVIRAENRPEGGARFVVELPAA